jgi:hypothetical protein
MQQAVTRGTECAVIFMLTLPASRPIRSFFVKLFLINSLSYVIQRNEAQQLLH